MNRWEAKGYANYSMRFERECFCRPGFLGATLHVEAGTIVDYMDVTDIVGPLNDSTLVAWDITLSSFDSIEGLFEIIQAAIESNADEIAVSYHGELGYPESIDIDYYFSVYDEEIVYHTSDLVERL